MNEDPVVKRASGLILGAKALAQELIGPPARTGGAALDAALGRVPRSRAFDLLSTVCLYGFISAVVSRVRDVPRCVELMRSVDRLVRASAPELIPLRVELEHAVESSDADQDETAAAWLLKSLNCKVPEPEKKRFGAYLRKRCEDAEWDLWCTPNPPS